MLTLLILARKALGVNKCTIISTLCHSHNLCRSWLFSLGDGLAYAGMATGSFLGALLIRQTGQVLSVFYVKTSVELAYFILLLTITPESLTKQQMRTSTRKYRQDLEDIVQNPETNLAVGLLSKFKTMFSFLSSLSIFLPVEKKGENALEQSAKDWSLTLLVLGFGMRACLTASVTYLAIKTHLQMLVHTGLC